MNLAQNIKNNQIAWGVGLSAVLLVVFGGGIWIANSSIFSFGSDSASQTISSQTEAKERDPVPENPGPSPKIKTVNGTVTEVNEEANLITVKNSVATRNDAFNTIKVKITNETDILLHTKSTPESEQVIPDSETISPFSTQTISLSDLRKEDTVAISLVNPLTEGNTRAKAKRIQVQGYK